MNASTRDPDRPDDPDNPYRERRERMVREQLMARGFDDARVLAALGCVPRHVFVPRPWRWASYGDRPLPIGSGQTISQPYVVALMAELAEVQPTDRVLEVGAGCGYMAAVLGELAAEVVAVEIVPTLAQIAAVNLERAGATNVQVECADGGRGFEALAPYNAILVSAAVPRVPPPLLEQLADGGRLVVPLGPPRGRGVLVRIVRRGDHFDETEHGAVSFVAFTGEYGERNPWEGS